MLRISMDRWGGTAWLFMMFAVGSWADTHYVVKDNVGASSPYTSWATAAANIGDAIGDAACVNGDTVLISNGVYTLSATITFNKSITVKSASTNRSDVVVDGDSTYRCFYLGIASPITGRLEGITVKNGLASDGNAGGGIRCYPGLAPGNIFTIADCVIVSNTATAGGGAGICVYSNSVVTNCLVMGNVSKSGNGGGLLFAGGAVVCNCEISGNVTTNYSGGGVAFTWNQHRGVMRDSVVSNNSANVSYAGGIYLSGTNTVEGCTIVDNYSGLYGGGGVAGYGGSTLRNCMIARNTSYGTTGGGGGGVYIGSACLVESCVISGNFATAAVASLGGGGLRSYGSDGVVRNCLIVNNSTTASDGGGVWVGYGGASKRGLTMENCTVVGNTAGGARNGGGLYAYNAWADATNIIYNTVFYDNTAGGTGSNWYGTVAFTVSNCCTMPTAGLPGGDNIEKDPQLADPASADYRLIIYRSPCVNAGVNHGWMTNAYDFAGNDRIIDGIVDIGAYEYVLPPCGTIFSMH